MLSFLGGYKWIIFRRLSLYLISEFPDSQPEILKENLLNKDNLNDFYIVSEYQRLALKGFQHLNEADKKTLLGWIEQGPDLEEISKSYTERSGKKFTEEDLQRQKEIWKRDALQHWVSVLPLEWQDKYKELVVKNGESWPRGVRVSWGYKSPVEADELAKWPIDKTIQFIKAWKPTGGFFEPTIEGVRQELRKAVIQNPGFFSDNASAFKGLQPSYIQGVFSGLREAVQNQKPINWGAVLDLCEWATKQNDVDLEKMPEEWEADATWKWAFMEVANLLEYGFRANAPPIEFRERLWGLVERTGEHKDPERDNEIDNSELDRYEKAINSIRGQSLECVIQYALWVRRQKEKEGLTISSFSDDLMEVQNALNKFLDPELNEVKTSGVVLGRYFPWIILLDREWGETNAGKIFSEPLINDPAWQAYILYSGRPYKQHFKIIRNLYKKAGDELSQHSRSKDENYHHNLADHIMFVMMVMEGVEPDGEEGIAASFVNNSTDEDRAYAVWCISRALMQNELDPDIIEVVKRYAEKRLNALDESTEYSKEYSRFGTWIGSKHLDIEWQLNLIEKVLKRIAKIDCDEDLFEFLLSSFGQHQARTLIVLEKILFDIAIDYWEISYNKDRIADILNAALVNEDLAVRNQTEEIINRLVAKGHTSYSDLLKK